jgi:hypothetical protein
MWSTYMLNVGNLQICLYEAFLCICASLKCFAGNLLYQPWIDHGKTKTMKQL